MRCLDMIHERRFKDDEELLEIIKRLFIPGYEQVRHHFDEAIEAGILEPNTSHGYPHMNQIKDILAWLQSEHG
ncbi:hypothetical protein [Sulfobacillus harzensis]|uniref:Uncharacterized protein n=1 Tax=Sulfobacillus harzensis TaxID=2729629 RepID=A0A7Y0Q4P7_9FIRM|nr:hypothetical protein [Sulfobacillus harzensis]NMP24256.1 hypothetical protein [Sulfobacillus harzensis]